MAPTVVPSLTADAWAVMGSNGTVAYRASSVSGIRSTSTGTPESQDM